MDFGEGLKKVFLAGVGAVASTAEAAGDLINNLVQKGELTVEQGKVLNEELKQNAKEKINDHVTVNIIKEYKDVMTAMEKMSAEELEKVKKKLSEMEAKKEDAKDTAEETAPEDAAAETPSDTEEAKESTGE